MSDGVEIVPPFIAVLRGVFCLRFYGLSGPVVTVITTENVKRKPVLCY